MTTSRSDLISLLSEACELEHGLACSYLYSAFTIKQSVYEDDLTWQEFQFTRKWAGQLYFIASQEMLHLAQVWNLLTAIGGTPYYFRPNYPVTHRYYPTNLPIITEPFGKSALKRFIFYELPTHIDNISFLVKEFKIPVKKIGKSLTVGALYKEIENGFKNIDPELLFIGNKDLQIGSETSHFNDLVKVVDQQSALHAIETIVLEGEGNSNDQMDCHYGMFINIEKEYDNLLKLSKKEKRIFKPARDCIQNPATINHMDMSPPDANVLDDDFTDQVAVLFDNVYSLMLRILQYIFESGSLPENIKNTLADVAIQLMTRVIKPLGESLTLLPAGKKYGHQMAGPSFGLYRHVSIPVDFAAAFILIKERLEEIIASGKILSENKVAPIPLKDGIIKLESILDFIKNGSNGK